MTRKIRNLANRLEKQGFETLPLQEGKMLVKLGRNLAEIQTEDLQARYSEGMAPVLKKVIKQEIWRVLSHEKQVARMDERREAQDLAKTKLKEAGYILSRTSNVEYTIYKESSQRRVLAFWYTNNNTLDFGVATEDEEKTELISIILASKLPIQGMATSMYRKNAQTTTTTEKGNTMNEAKNACENACNKEAKPKGIRMKQITYLGGKDITETTDDELIDAVQQLKEEKARLVNAMSAVSSKKVSAKIEEIDETIKLVVAYLDKDL